MTKFHRAILLISLIAVSPHALGGGKEVSNGGGAVKSEFQKAGLEIIDFLRFYSPGQDLARKYQFDVDRLERTLADANVAVSSEDIFDSSGSLADAIVDYSQTLDGVSKIILREAAWLDHLDQSRPLRKLVLHEMLRSVRYYDDEFVISGPVESIISGFLGLNSSPPQNLSFNVQCWGPLEARAQVLVTDSGGPMFIFPMGTAPSTEGENFLWKVSAVGHHTLGVQQGASGAVLTSRDGVMRFQLSSTVSLECYIQVMLR